MSSQITDEDTLKILVATDNHLGYAEKDPIRGNDSFDAFEEILCLACENNVDMILLGGDLFHEANPSSYCMTKCIELLKKYCTGDKAVEIEFKSDPNINFKHLEKPVVNYEDPNLNISIPVFSIHGNHDDPTGHKQISALDVLSRTGLINYFGRQESTTNVIIKPLLLSKGETRLAIYGLSHLRDERLSRLYHDKKISNEKPEGDMWFHLMVLHQNRVDRGRKRFIPSTFLPSYIDLVIWGHEHDCYIEAVEENGVFIIQPGSSVATSLSEGESLPKHVGLLNINRKKFKMCPILLKSVRPFLYREIHLDPPDTSRYNKEDPSKQAMNSVGKIIMEMLEKIKKETAGTSREKMLPLIRINVMYNDERQGFSSMKLCQQFVDEIANPSDAILLKHYNADTRRNRNRGCQQLGEEEMDMSEEEQIDTFLQKELSKKKFKILSGKLMTEALHRFVESGDDQAFSSCVDKQINCIVQKLIDEDASEEDILETLPEITELDFTNAPTTNLNIDETKANDSDEELNVSEATTSNGRGGRGKGRGRARGKNTVNKSPNGNTTQSTVTNKKGRRGKFF